MIAAYYEDDAIAITVTIWNFFGIISVDAIILLLLPIPSCTPKE